MDLSIFNGLYEITYEELCDIEGEESHSCKRQ